MEQLAANVTAETLARQSAQYLGLTMGSELFGIALASVREVIRYTEPTPVPMMPECIRGVINLRGAVVPVMDLASRLGRPAADVTRRTCIVVIETGKRGEHGVAGVMVDAVSTVYEIPLAEVEAPPAFGLHMPPGFLLGMGRANGRFVLLLDLRQVVSDEELSLQVQ